MNLRNICVDAIIVDVNIIAEHIMGESRDFRPVCGKLNDVRKDGSPKA